MASKYLGVEFGNNRLKICEVNDDEVKSFVCVDMLEGLVEDGNIISFSALSEFLNETLKENKIKTKKACLVLPDTAVLLRKIKMPYMTISQLMVNLPYEFKDYLTEDKSQYIFDYALTGLDYNESGKVVSMELCAVAIRKSLMDSYQKLFKEVGLKLTQAVPQELAVSNAFDVLLPDTSKKDYAILDIGYKTTRLTMYHKGIYETNRTLEDGCIRLVSAIANEMNIDERIAFKYLVDDPEHVLDGEAVQEIYSDISVSVMRALNYYTYDKRDAELETLYVCGSGSRIEQLVNALKQTIALNVVTMGEISNDINVVEGMTESPALLGACWNQEG